MIPKYIIPGELLVIVEYCPFGNIQQFLKKNRLIFEDHFNANRDKSLKVAEFDNSKEIEPLKTCQFRKHSLMGNSYSDKEIERSVSTEDLTSWAFQVSK